jgi:hypothetical protein
VNLYNYCERYLTASKFEAYRELALHPAPISILTTPIMILSFMIPNKTIMGDINDAYSKFNFWLENLLFIAAFTIFELLMVIPVWIKNIAQIAWASKGLFITVFNTAIWIFAGLFITFYILVTDVVNLFKLLKDLQGCRSDNNQECKNEEDKEDEDVLLLSC